MGDWELGCGEVHGCAGIGESGELAIEADWDGYSRWVDRGERTARCRTSVSGDPRMAGAVCLAHQSTADRRLSAKTGRRTAFLCGSAENEAEVRDLFALVICLMVDDKTLRDRLRTRTTNAFGRNPEEFAAALAANCRAESEYRRLGATIIDGTLPEQRLPTQWVPPRGA